MESNVEVLHFSEDNKVRGSYYIAPKRDGALLGKKSQAGACAGVTQSCSTH